MTDLDPLRKADPFLRQYEPSDLRIASEFLNTWLPFLSRDLCHHCTQTLSNRIRALDSEPCVEAEPSHSRKTETPSALRILESSENLCDDSCENRSAGSSKDGAFDGDETLGGWKDGWSEPVSETPRGILGAAPLYDTSSHRISWADMAQEDELEEEKQKGLSKQVVDMSDSIEELKISDVAEKPKLSREQREYIRYTSVKRKKDFICLERVKGKFVNILQGLELHSGVFSAAEQTRIVNYVYELQDKAKKGELKERTYTAPQKWMKGKGRVTIQFGCCYNYAPDKNGNPPGILQNETVDPIPNLFKEMIRRLVKWHVLPPTCVPDSCIVNIYDEGDCIPPHIDNHDFVRPFCTVSFLSECNILFGTNLQVVGAGDFSGSYPIPLPVGSVLVINGNAADVSKHCVPSVPTKRISITFRKMDETKRPLGFVPAPDLQGIEPLTYDVEGPKTLSSSKSESQRRRHPIGKEGKPEARGFVENGSQSEPRYSSQGRRGYANKWRAR